MAPFREPRNEVAYEGTYTDAFQDMKHGVFMNQSITVDKDMMIERHVGLKYYGGPVVQSVKVLPIFYGDVVYQQELHSFYEFAVKSPIMDIIMTEYSPPDFPISHGSVLPALKISKNVQSLLDDLSDVKPLLRNLVSTGAIQPTVNTYFALHLAPGVNSSFSGGFACTDFCGYRTIDVSDISAAQHLYYSVIPDQTGACQGSCGGSSDPFENLCSLATHQLAEVVTNPAIGLATKDAAPLAWYDINGKKGEISDFCNGKADTAKDSNGKTWTVQKIWSNRLKKCISNYATAGSDSERLERREPQNKKSTKTTKTTTTRTTKTTKTTSTRTTKTTTTKANKSPTTTTSTKTTKTTTTKTTKTTTTTTTTAKAAAPTPNNAKNLNYYGGPVLAKINVVPIFYGAAADQSRTVDFYKYLVKSPYMDLMIQDSSVPAYPIEYGTVQSPVYITSNLKTSLDDEKDIWPFLRNLVKTGVITPTEFSYYPIHFQPKVSIQMGGKGSCVYFCGYHGTIDISDISDYKYMYYGVLPDQAGDCMGGCGDSWDAFENMCSVASHEFAEALTDPGVGLAGAYADPLGWYNPDLGENADICNAMSKKVTDPDNGNVWTVQAIWSNTGGQCLIAPLDAAPVVTTTAAPVATSKSTSSVVVAPSTTSQKPITTTAKTTTASPQPTGSVGSDPTYYEGPILSYVYIYPIFYGSISDQEKLYNLYDALSFSSYMTLIGQEYSTADTTIGYGWINSPVSVTTSLKTTVDDVNDIVPMLKQMVTNGDIYPRANTYHPIHLAKGVQVTKGGLTSCVDFCSYHAAIDISDIGVTQFLYYSVIPDQTSCKAASTACSTASTVFDATSAVISREFVNAVTNPAMGAVTSVTTPLVGWYHSTKGDVGNLCTEEVSFTDWYSRTWNVRKVWSRSLQKCVVSA
ncbi:hypothetical protein HDU80_008655 [Chytriomyces hyalinus]|nr:hypothetical protein HDU80_008655 [Chytriomyces hyalinus]